MHAWTLDAVSGGTADHEAVSGHSRRCSYPLDAPNHQNQGQQAAKPAGVEAARRKSGTTPTKAMAMATRGCFRSILSTTADGNPCTTVMPLSFAALLTPTAASRPDNDLRVFCSADTPVAGSQLNQTGLATSTALTDTSTCRDALIRQLDESLSRPSPPKDRPSNDSSSRSGGDVFLSASIQLSHLQSDAHQRVRQLWYTVQRLRWENQISDSAVDALHKEMLALAKCASAEKLDSSKFTKTGYLKLVQAPLSATAALKQQSVKALFGANASKPVGQLVWCALSEEQARFEMSPVREPPGSTPSAQTSSSSGAPAGKPTLANSLIGIFSDAFQATDQEDIKRTLIKLHGCHVRTIPTAANGVGSDESDKTSEAAHRFQILVPHCDAVGRAGGSPSHAAWAISYDIYVFEAAPALSAPSLDEAGEDGGSSCVVPSWVRAIDRVCMFHLHKLEERVRGVESAADYRDVLSRSFPLTIPLTWLRNRQDRVDLHGAGEAAGHHQEDQRRASQSVTMVQIIKDLERDRVLLDQRLMCTADSLSADNAVGGGGVTPATLDIVSEIFKYLVVKVMASFAPPTGSASIAGAAPSSPSRRFVSFNEAKAVAFVERVLRGCSRTQSGGDIYDAICFLCQHHRVSICPLSQEACPVQISTAERVEGLGEFYVEVTVCMRFKVIELTPTTPTSSRAAKQAAPGETDQGKHSEGEPPIHQRRGSLQRRNSLQRRDSLREWAVIEGTLVRRFTPGKASTPGSVTVDFVHREVR